MTYASSLLNFVYPKIHFLLVISVEQHQDIDAGHRATKTILL